MKFEEFKLEDMPHPSQQVLYLDVTTLTGGDMLRLAVLVASGSRPGPTIAVLGGVHGDEYEGQHAVRQVFSALDPALMTGTFIGVPVTNVPAFAAASRDSPIDGLNLARVFPGNRTGTPTERIAYYVSNYIIGRADFLIDLHSSGTPSSLPFLVGYYAHDSEPGRKSREAALVFGAPVVRGGAKMIIKGSTVSDATDRGIPWLFTECPAGGWLHQDFADLYTRGVINVMRHMDMLPGPIEMQKPQYYLNGDAEHNLAAGAAGFLLPRVKPSDRVRKGDLLGQVLGLAGEVLDEVRADCDGVVFFMRANPSIYTGDRAFAVVEEVEQAI